MKLMEQGGGIKEKEETIRETKKLITYKKCHSIINKKRSKRKERIEKRNKGKNLTKLLTTYDDYWSVK